MIEGNNRPLHVDIVNPPGGNVPHSIEITRLGYLVGHPSFKDFGSNKIMAVIRNEEGLVIGGLEVSEDFLEAEVKGGATRRIARIDVCDALGISQDIIDN